LKNHTGERVVVFAVWEPILATDTQAPGTGILGRLNDSRVRQFWDRGHAVASAIKTAADATNLHPNCCEADGVLWDMTAVYEPGAAWADRLPKPILLDGAIVKIQSQLESVINKH